MKFCFAIRQQHYLQEALLPLSQRGPRHLYLEFVAARVPDFQWSISSHLDAIAVYRTGRQAIGSKAGTRIIHFQKLDRFACAVFYCHINVVGVAANGPNQHRG